MHSFEKLLSSQSELPNAQMAESVDALVSNTSGRKAVPVRSRLWVHRAKDNEIFRFFLFKSFAADGGTEEAKADEPTGRTYRATVGSELMRAWPEQLH